MLLKDIICMNQAQLLSKLLEGKDPDMSVEKVKIEAVMFKEIDTKYGTSMNVRIKQNLEQGFRWIGVFVRLDAFKEDDWPVGKVVTLDVTKNGDYWNGKIPKAEVAQAAAVAIQVNDKLLEGMRYVYTKLKAIEETLARIEESYKPNVESKVEDKVEDVEPVFPDIGEPEF